MLRKKIAVAATIVAATISLGGAPVVGLGLMQDETRGLPTTVSVSESASLFLFGSGLWALAMLRRQRRPSPSA
jgi:hypothetical protein